MLLHHDHEKFTYTVTHPELLLLDDNLEAPGVFLYPQDDSFRNPIPASCLHCSEICVVRGTENSA